METETVLVTGASGYLALHCVKELLERGYHVRGTVRSTKNQHKVAPLLRLPNSERLELVEADLLIPECWKSVISGCDYILHVASPWPIVADASTVKTAIEGTLNVLRAASKCPEVKKIVLTSSCAAVNGIALEIFKMVNTDGHKNGSRVFDETCWTDLENSGVEHYARSKTLAEKAAWNYWKSLGPDRFALTVLNPTFVTGPVLSNCEHGSATVVARMMDWRTYLAAPRVSLGVVDVRDVAAAHSAALKRPETDGERILITSQPSVWMRDWTRWLTEEFAPLGYYISPVETPNWLFRLYAATRLDPQAASVGHRIGPLLKFDNSKSIRLLGVEYRSPKESLIEMVYSMLSEGMIKSTKKVTKKLAESPPVLSEMKH